MSKDNYQGTKSRYELVGDYAVSRATGVRLDLDESRGIKHLDDWRYTKRDGVRHEYSDHDCGLEKAPYKLRCTGLYCTFISSPRPGQIIPAGEEHVHAVKYNCDDDILKGFGRIISDDYICAYCWEKITGKLINRQRFARVGPEL